jgi:gamma-glutamylaminecyclotransferase
MKVFVYGSLQRGRWNNRLLANATFLGEAVTDSTFEMVDVGYPIMRPSATRNARKVKGELFDIGNDAGTLAALDRLEGVDRGLYERVTGFVMCDGRRRRADYYIRRSEVPAPVVSPNKDGLLEWRARA